MKPSFASVPEHKFLLKNSRKKQKFMDDKMAALEAIQRKRYENENISGLYSSFEGNKVFDSNMVKSIENGMDCTDERDRVSSHGLNIVSGM